MYTGRRWSIQEEGDIQWQIGKAMEGKQKVKNKNNGSRVKKESKYKMDIKKDF